MGSGETRGDKIGMEGLALHPPHAIQSIIKHKLGRERRLSLVTRGTSVLVRLLDAKPIQTEAAEGVNCPHGFGWTGERTIEKFFGTRKKRLRKKTKTKKKNTRKRCGI